MRYKPDWEDARKRLTALWNHDLVDRPCIAVTAPNGRSVDRPPAPASAHQKWLDPDWVLRDLTARIESTWWGGEALPSYLLMGGWVLCLGGTPKLEMRTIWYDTVEVDYSSPPPFRYVDDDNWVKTHAYLYEAAADLAGQNDFSLGRPCALPANDILSMVMGAETFLLALKDHPEWMRDALITAAREQCRVRKDLRSRIQDKHDFWYTNGGFMPFWGPEPFFGTQSDVSCMLAPEMFEEFIVPEFEIQAEAFGHMWYHLDGCDAYHHLPRLLSLPFLRVMQYTASPHEPPNGPDHLDLYRRIQSAGKIVHVRVTKENVEPLVRNLDPTRLMLDTSCDSVAEGEALLEASEDWI
ncbi:MAG: hypothetical protein QGI83_15610 [Candidatus Latescibacteria bacterium]|nr:hypothetical protein [Candidatus Latescibacterota bacterium]